MNFLIIGDGCLDIRRECIISRLCPEAPIPVLNPVSTTQNPGMAGNVLMNIRSLGAQGTLISQLTPTKKTRYIDKQTGYIVARVDENDVVAKEESFPSDRWQTQWEISSCDGIIISDYNKGFLSEKNIEYIAKEARRQNIPTFLDTKKQLDSYSKDITVVKINEKEFFSQKCPSFSDVCQNLVVTMGERGCVWYNHDKVNTEPVTVSDVSGAGDTFLAAFAIRYVETGGNIRKAMEFGNKAARVAVSRHGIIAVTRQEILN